MRGATGGVAEDDGKSLGWKDYVALFIALLQTVGLPLVVLILIILGALAVLRLLH
ncbi:MAG: hypothetical protein OK442_03390 [Thaumarchaeota archaeon]|nr:hypothetical protein [Nitrososphaerota archaeon]